MVSVCEDFIIILGICKLICLINGSNVDEVRVVLLRDIKVEISVGERV